MRPILALLIPVVILGGLQLYMSFRPQPARREAEAEVRARGRFAAELTLTFDAGPDEFAVDVSNAPSLRVLLRGREILRQTQVIPAGRQVRIDDVPDVVAGSNEFYVEATPRDLTQDVARAVRVRMLRNESPIADATLWSEPGDPVRGSLVVDVPAWSTPDQAAPETSVDHLEGARGDAIGD